MASYCIWLFSQSFICLKPNTEVSAFAKKPRREVAHNQSLNIIIHTDCPWIFDRMQWKQHAGHAGHERIEGGTPPEEERDAKGKAV